MNVLEREMIGILTELKDRYGVFEIKAEFEAEGSRMEEMMRLKDVTGAVGLPIILKIGGVEAVTDIYNALSLGVKGIVAPMAETAFALSKYVGTIKNLIAPDNAAEIEFAFNVETETACRNLDKMLALPDINVMTGVTVGRVDLVGSLGKDRRSVNDDDIYTLCREVLVKAKKAGLKTGMGGAISADSLPFLGRLSADGLLDKYETRKVVFPAGSVRHGEAAITAAVRFELLWLRSKRRYYSKVRDEDETRIAMIEKRLNGNKK